MEARKIRSLARALKRCGQTTYCQSGACPICQWHLQEYVVSMQPQFEKLATEPIGVASIIPSEKISLNDDRAVGAVEQTVEQFLALAAAEGISLAIGGVDFSINEHAVAAFEPHIQPHFWIMGRLSELRSARQGMAAVYAAGAQRHTSVKIFPFDGNARAFAYAIKWRFVRRVTIPPLRDRNGHTTRRQNTRNRPLRWREHVQLYDVLHQLGLERRLILIGIDVQLHFKGDAGRSRP